MVLPSTCILRVANSTPIVDFDSKLNSFLVNRDKRLLLPTPESPMRTTGKTKIIGQRNVNQRLNFDIDLPFNKRNRLINFVYCFFYIKSQYQAIWLLLL